MLAQECIAYLVFYFVLFDNTESTCSCYISIDFNVYLPKSRALQNVMIIFVWATVSTSYKMYDFSVGLYGTYMHSEKILTSF